MRFFSSIWTSVTYVTHFLTLSPFEGPSSQEQVPLLPDVLHPGSLSGPVFKPPGGGLTGPDADFTCDYSKMVGWSSCSTADNRACWLKNDKTGLQYNISTDYEDVSHAPNGTHRHYVVDVTDRWINADGLNFTEGKVFNGKYPGPWIQACWGDTVTIIVNNHLKSNGTSIHWHGIRQWLTMNMDGVNGLTQCPIAPGDSFNYTWRATQYGSSWYHSHYSVQYADGALGPMTLHGPTSEPYDEAKRPMLMTDWAHNGAFESVQTGVFKAPSILLNGIGNVTRYNSSVAAKLPVPEPYTLHFDPPAQGRAKRYLLRLINTSFHSTFVFSIDNHTLQIVGADFVPLHSYTNTSVLIGIGQRYHVIVTANNPLSKEGNYWIRTWRANCFLAFPSGLPGYEKIGTLRYGDSHSDPITAPWNDISLACSDETYTSLKPIVPWTIGPAANNEILTVNLDVDPTIFPLAAFSLGGDTFNPLRINYGDPTFLHLDYSGKWDPLWVVFPENYTDTDWVHLVIRGTQRGTIGAHPIHLHGHDFAILQQIENTTYPNKLNLKLDNPPRRDVVLLPTDGYVVIAFKTDNPGTWLMHCHIAVHASNGLAVQFLERQSAAETLFPALSKPLNAAQQGCNNWNKWWGDCKNWWPGDGSSCRYGDLGFSPDSGI